MTSTTRRSSFVELATNWLPRAWESAPSSASTQCLSPRGNQCAYHWSVVVGLVCPSWAATYVRTKELLSTFLGAPLGLCGPRGPPPDTSARGAGRRGNDSVGSAGPARASGAPRGEFRGGGGQTGPVAWRRARSRAGQAAGTTGGGGSAARPSAASSRRTAWGSVTAPRIRRGPPQRSHTRTSIANTRRRTP
jgi:hypothetical protein